MYDQVIIGGGLAGLTCAYRLSKAGYSVALVEKGDYPQHRVCGEYLSAEVEPFLEREGLWPKEYEIPFINQMLIRHQDGFEIKSALSMGGYGISRYLLDHTLYLACLKNGVHILVNTTAVRINHREVSLKSGETLEGKLIIGAFGKRSNLDRSLNRSWKDKKSPYLGVKYHRRGQIDRNTVSLYNFKGGYCGVTAIEDNLFNCCYLVHQDELRKSGSISDMEEQTLFKNDSLRHIFTASDSVWEEPISIGAISFLTKSTSDHDIPMIGDAAGMITPLCGNGMAMAIQGAYLLSALIIDSDDHLSSSSLCQQYDARWRKKYARQLMFGRNIQRLMIHPRYASWAYRTLAKSPWMIRKIISSTHGGKLS